jgi:hypothetical protein
MNIIELQTFLQACMHAYIHVDIIYQRYLNSLLLTFFADGNHHHVLQKGMFAPSCFYRKLCSIYKIQHLEWLREREREREREEEGKSEEEKESEERGRRGKGKASCPSGMDVAPELTEFSPNFKAPVLAGYQLLATTSPGRLSKY